jgi:hypothetical protein
MAVTRLQAIRNFLTTQDCKNPLWSEELETQVNVGEHEGELVREGKRRTVIYEGENGQKWYHFRIPFNAKSDDHSYKDPVMSYDLAAYADRIGSTGWNWKKNTSEWLAYDFDSIANHTKGLSADDLKETLRKLKEIPWVEIRKSKSGNGFHVFVVIHPDIRPVVNNHSQHAALAKAVLHSMSGLTGFKFEDSVDCVGSNVWLWSRDSNISNGAFELVKKGEMLTQLPANWEFHLETVKSRTNKRSAFVEMFKEIDGVADSDVQSFIDLNAKTHFVSLDDRHRKLVKYVTENKLGWWDQNHNCLVTHTTVLSTAHDVMQLRGMFRTAAAGRIEGDHNCFCFPNREGWTVRRYTKNVDEHTYWTTDSSGWKKCVFDSDPDLETVIRTYNGVLGSKGDYEFESGDDLAKALKTLGFSLTVDVGVARRSASLFVKKDMLIVKIAYQTTDPTSSDDMKGWRKEPSAKPKNWVRVFKFREKQKYEQDNCDHIVRGVKNEHNFEGFFLRTVNGEWLSQPKSNLADGIQHYGYNVTESKAMIGAATVDPWQIVSEPFQPEYLGDRQWNLKAAQLACEPIEGEHPTWDKIMTHAGEGMNDAVEDNAWCKQNGVKDGADYLRLWLAYMFQRPKMSLPYLSFYSKSENTGKSSIHESLSTLFVMERGYQRCETCIKSDGMFNGELLGTVLGVIEEIDLNQRKYSDKIKDWVTSRYLSIHPKGGTPFMVENTTHWMQFSNNPDYTPMFDGDTRIVLIGVSEFGDGEEIDRHILDQRVQTENPAFIYTLLNYALPEPTGRLQIPVVMTSDKMSTMESKMTAFDTFLKDRVHLINGQLLNVSELYLAARNWITKEYGSQIADEWSDRKMAMSVPRSWPKGMYGKDRKTFFGNRTLDPDAETGSKFIMKPGGRELYRLQI